MAFRESRGSREPRENCGAEGATNLGNLVLLCHAHHRLVHEERWTIRGHPERDLRFHDPGGRRLRSFAEERSRVGAG